jgi:hypothetical protein
MEPCCVPEHAGDIYRQAGGISETDRRASSPALIIFYFYFHKFRIMPSIWAPYKIYFNDLPHCPQAASVLNSSGEMTSLFSLAMPREAVDHLHTVAVQHDFSLSLIHLDVSDPILFSVYYGVILLLEV